MNTIFNIANEIADGVMQHTDKHASLGASLNEEVQLHGEGSADTQIIAVHILFEGQPLCGFNDSMPCNWPENHFFVGVYDQKNATCPECLAAMKNLPLQLPRI